MRTGLPPNRQTAQPFRPHTKAPAIQVFGDEVTRITLPGNNEAAIGKWRDPRHVTNGIGCEDDVWPDSLSNSQRHDIHSP